jgi:formaldehyde-activating enzyme involved in methanogenesis
LQRVDEQQGRLHQPFGGDCSEPALQTEHGDVQQGDHQRRQAGRADVRSGAIWRSQGGAGSVADGTIPAAEADDLFICVGVFIHWEAESDAKIQDYNYRATEALERAVAGTPTAAEATKQRDSVKHPFGAS